MGIQQAPSTHQRPRPSAAELAGRPLTPAARRILDVASELFYAHGIHAVGMEWVAAAAEVTKKTIYDRFGSKDALVTAYLTARDLRYRDWLASGIRPYEGDPRRQLLVTFDLLDAWLRENGRRGCAFVNAFAELADPAHPARAVAVRQKVWLRDHFRDLATTAGATDPGALADQLLTLHEGATVLDAVTDSDTALVTARTAAAVLIAGAVARG